VANFREQSLGRAGLMADQLESPLDSGFDLTAISPRQTFGSFF
jgi:hypothetical protein